MDYTVTSTYYLPPGDFRVAFTYFIWDMSGSFTN